MPVPARTDLFYASEPERVARFCGALASLAEATTLAHNLGGEVMVERWPGPGCTA